MKIIREFAQNIAALKALAIITDYIICKGEHSA
jgi:hypothetical protein